MAETTVDAVEPIGLTAEADDDAILDMIALEMAADDPSDFVDVADMETVDVFGSDPADVAAEPAETAAAGRRRPIPSAWRRSRWRQSRLPLHRRCKLRCRLTPSRRSAPR